MRELRDEEGEGGWVKVRIRKNENGEILEDIYEPVSGFFFYYLKPKPTPFALRVG